MTATHPDFLQYIGSTWEFDASLHDAACQPLDVTDADIAWRLYNSQGGLVLELGIGAGITVTNAVGGLCKITVTAEQSKALSQGSYRDEIVVTLPNGYVSTQAVGNILVQKPGSLPMPPGSVEDPCTTLAKLNAARLAILTGQTMSLVRIEGFEVRYTAASINELDNAIGYYDQLCRQSTGKKPRRFAIGSGARSRTY
ncbi:MAG TPA: hypothetical protein VFQ80_11625 [Thermomicrobiales bacterium]|jgi:hypothetical protein|nr:hypothetical protein [Thermomicrobiales bacterium]